MIACGRQALRVPFAVVSADPSILAELADMIASGHALVVVGAGVSLACTEAAETASWIGLLKNGVRRAGALSRMTPDESDTCLAALSDPTLSSLLDVADKVTAALGGQKGGEFASWLRRAFADMAPADPALLEALVALRSPMATTNYDGLIEGVTGWEAVTWMRPSEFQRVHRGDARAVLHFHGWWKNPESVVFGSASYDAIITDPAASSALRSLAWARSWIFVGFGAGIEDPNFAALREWLKLAEGGSEYRHYRLVLDSEVPGAVALHDVDERIVPVVYGSNHDALLPFIQALAPPSRATTISTATELAKWAEDERTAATARIVGRLLAVGMDAMLADQLAADPAIGSAVLAGGPMTDGTVRLVTGDLGSGKSTVADRLHQRNVDMYEQGAEGRIPVYARVRLLTAEALDVQVRAAAFADPAANGVLLVLDGADESPDRDLTTLLTETQALVRSWPGSAAVVFSRSPPEHRQPDVQNVELPRLGIDDAEALVRRVANRRLWVRSWPDGLRDAVRRPLFALLAGVLIGSEEAAVSIPSLIDRLVDLSLREARQNHPNALDVLSRLAAAWLDTGRAVTLADHAPTFAERSAISGARLVAVDQAGRLTFPIPVIAEWLGARRLLSDPHLLESIIDDSTRLDRWRYAVTVAVATGARQQTSVLIHMLATRRPAIASWVIGEGASGGWARGDEPLPDAFEAGAQIRSAMNTWAEGLGPLADLVSLFKPDGTLLTIAVHTNGQTISTAWCRGDDLPPVVVDKGDMSEQRILRGRGGHVAGTTTWEWQWTWEEFGSAIQGLLKGQRLPPVTPQLQAETDYRLAVAITRSATGPASLRPITTAEIAAVVTRLSPRTLVHGSDPWRSEDGHRLLQRLQQRGAATVDPPWPGCDLPPGGFIWDGFSPHALAERGEAASKAALNAYRAVVDTWFPRFADDLSRSVMWPFNLVVNVAPGRGPGWDSAPSLRWHLEPLPTGQTSTSTWIVDTDAERGRHWISRPGFEQLWARWREVRPELGSRVHLTVSSGHHGLFRLDPATRFLYGWLWDELSEVKWVKGTAPMLD